MDLTCLPAILHNPSNKITNAVHSCMAKHSDSYQQIFIIYTNCGTGGSLQAACEEIGVEIVGEPHCYYFFEGNDRFSNK